MLMIMMTFLVGGAFSNLGFWMIRLVLSVGIHSIVSIDCIVVFKMSR